MPMTAISTCAQCKAVINIHWTACLVCKATISTVSGVSAPHQHTPDLPEQIGGSVAPDPPPSPLPLPCFVTFTDSQGRLRGGWEERATCMVKQCHGVGAHCQAELVNGDKIPLRAVRAVGQLNAEGRLIGAWSVRDHGYDGQKTGGYAT